MIIMKKPIDIINKGDKYFDTHIGRLKLNLW